VCKWMSMSQALETLTKHSFANVTGGICKIFWRRSLVLSDRLPRTWSLCVVEKNYCYAMGERSTSIISTIIVYIYQHVKQHPLQSHASISMKRGLPNTSSFPHNFPLTKSETRRTVTQKN